MLQQEGAYSGNTTEGQDTGALINSYFGQKNYSYVHFLIHYLKHEDAE